MRLYLAGPMTGYPRFNYPAFHAMAEVLRRMDHDVVSPAEMDDPEDVAAAMASPNGSMDEFHRGSPKTWGDFLARDVKLLADDGIEGIVVLDGWEESRGARLETFVARLAGLPIYRLLDYYGGSHGLIGVTDLTLYRAWCNEPYLSIEAPWVAEEKR